MPMNSGRDFKAREAEVAQPLMAAGPVGGNQGGDYVLQPAYAIQERAVSENPAAGPDGIGVRADDCAYTLEARTVPQAVAYSVALRGREGGGTAELGDDLATCLRASGGGGDKPHVLVQMRVRRLTEVECERLQGFPDNHTRVPVAWFKQKRVSRNRPEDLWEECPTGGFWLMAAAGPRYKQVGNAMAVDVIEDIGGRLDRLWFKRDLYGHNGGPPLDDFDAVLG